MQGSEMVRMELKYCECCGGLLLRPVGTEATYCAACAARIRELAPRRPSKRRGRPPKVVTPVVQAAEPDVAPVLQEEVLEEVHAVALVPKRPCQSAETAFGTCETRRMA